MAEADSNAPQTLMQARGFALFPKLPAELRDMIWIAQTYKRDPLDDDNIFRGPNVYAKTMHPVFCIISKYPGNSSEGLLHHLGTCTLQPTNSLSIRQET